MYIYIYICQGPGATRRGAWGGARNVRATPAVGPEAARQVGGPHRESHRRQRHGAWACSRDLGGMALGRGGEYQMISIHHQNIYRKQK